MRADLLLLQFALLHFADTGVLLRTEGLWQLCIKHVHQHCCPNSICSGLRVTFWSFSPYFNLFSSLSYVLRRSVSSDDHSPKAQTMVFFDNKVFLHSRMCVVFLDARMLRAITHATDHSVNATFLYGRKPKASSDFSLLQCSLYWSICFIVVLWKQTAASPENDCRSSAVQDPSWSSSHRKERS